MQKNFKTITFFRKKLFLIDHFDSLFAKHDNMQMKNLSFPKRLTEKQKQIINLLQSVFFFGSFVILRIQISY